MAVELAPHQLKAINELSNGKILCGGVGVGKSRTALAYYFLKDCGGSLKINGEGAMGKMADPKPLYIITTAKKRDNLDWVDECAPFCLSRDPESSFEGLAVTIDSWNNLKKYSDVKGAFFIFDEQRLVGSGAWVKAFLKIVKQNRWILLSATPGDTWMDFVPVFIANGFYKNKTEFIRRHVVYSNFSKFPKIDHYVEQGRLQRFRLSLLVDMPYQRTTVRHHHAVIVDYDPDLYETVVKKRWNPYKEEPIKDVGQLGYVARRVLNSDPSRLEAVKAIAGDYDKIILFYNFNYELDALRTLGDNPEITVAEWNGHKHEPVPPTGRWIYLVQYSSGAEGWNCTDTNCIVFYSLNYSYRLMHQSEGRIDRLNTPYTDLHYYTFRSLAGLDKAITKSVKSKQDFNQKAFFKF